MRIAIGVILSVHILTYVGQVVSAINFRWAQAHRLQERSETSDPLVGRLELWTARWDTLWLWTLPAAGLLMLLEHSWWPYVAMIGGGAWVDAGGREAAKVSGLRDRAVRVGTERELRTIRVALAVIVASGLLAIVAGLGEVT